MGLSHSKPVVIVTGPDTGGTAAWLFTRLAVYRAGGRARRLQPCRLGIDPNTSDEMAASIVAGELDAADAVIIGGGADIELRRYGVEREEADRAEQQAGVAEHLSIGERMIGWSVHALRWVFRRRRPEPADNVARDIFEDAMIRGARERRLPLLGICRGSQLLSLVNGGKLHTNLTAFYVEQTNPYSPLPCKTCVIAQDSRVLAKAMRVPPGAELHINALHHQAVDEPGDDLQVAATEKGNDVTQAIEAQHADDWWALGTQFHPEYLVAGRFAVNIFRALVDEARRRASKRD